MPLDVDLSHEELHALSAAIQLTCPAACFPTPAQPTRQRCSIHLWIVAAADPRARDHAAARKLLADLVFVRRCRRALVRSECCRVATIWRDQYTADEVHTEDLLEELRRASPPPQGDTE